MTTAALRLQGNAPEPATPATERQIASPLSAAAPLSPWIVTARYDLFFTLIAWLLPFALWAVASTGNTGLLVAALTFLLIDTTHQMASLPITIFDREVLRANRAFYLVGIAGLLAIACTVATTRGLAEQIWISLFVYWGIYHLIRQHIGFLRLYQVRGGMRDKRENSAQHICLYAGTAMAALFNLSRHMPMLDRAGIAHFNLREEFWWAAAAIFAGALAVVVRDCYRRRSRDESIAWLPLGYILLVLSNFWVGLMFAGRDELIIGVFFVSAFHDFQYYAIVWFMARRRHQAEPRAAGPLSWVFTGRTALPYLVFIALGGVLIEVVQQRWAPLRMALERVSPQLPVYVFAIFGSTQYIHFYLDQRAWRLRNDVRLRRDLLSPVAIAR